MNKFISYLATFLLLTVSTAMAECPPGATNCNLRGSLGDTRYYPARPCVNYDKTQMLKGAPHKRKAYNADCGASVKVYPLTENMREQYMQRGLPTSPSYAPRSTGAYPDGRYGGFAPKEDYNLGEVLDRCIKKDINSKDHNKRIECLDAFDRALNDPAFTNKHRELVQTLVGFLKANVPANGLIDRPDLNMGTEILARNHRLDRDGCFDFSEPNMSKVKEYLDSRSSVACKSKTKKTGEEQISENDGSYQDGLMEDEKNATPDNVSVNDGDYNVKGPDGKDYKLTKDGKLVNKDGKELLGPDGKPLTDTSDYKLSEDGKEVVGPDGKVYRVDEEGKYVGPDGRAVIGQDGAPVGPEGAVDPELAKQAALNAKANEMMKDPRYQDLLEENKKLRADKGVEDDLIDEEINSDKYLTKEQIASLVCNPSACKTSLDTKQSFEELLDGAIKTLENKKADIASRLNAICTAKCVSVNERKLEEKAITSLAKYVRRRVPWILTPNPEPEIETKSVRPDVQAALVAIAGKERSDNIGSVIDLTAVDLRGADLSQANLKNVDLSFSNLATTNLKNAKGLTRWDSIRLVVIDETTLIPESISAGYVVRRRPNIMPLEAGSFKVVTEDWISWKSILVNGQK